MTAEPGDDEPAAARPRPGVWLMAVLRLGAGWLVIARALLLLVAPPSPPGAALALPVRLAAAAALGIGLVAFAWPRTCLRGLALLLAGLAAVELLARAAGLPPTPRLPSAVAILAVLAAGEWLTSRLARGR
jgi:hypothetical protein